MVCSWLWLAGSLALPAAYALYWLVPGSKPSSFSHEKGESSAGESLPRRNNLTKDLVTHPAGCKTLYESMLRSTQNCPERNCLGTRETIREITKEVGTGENKRIWTTYERGPYVYKNYKESFDIIRSFASGLRHLGLKREEKLAVYEETCFEWLVAEQACYTQSFVVLTVYANLGLEALAYALNSAKVEFIIANGSLLSQLVKIKDEVHLKYVILTGGKDKTDQAAAAVLEKAGITMITFEEVLENGKKDEFEDVPPQPEDLACIMYTSGSTGLPKGVMITHASMIAAVGGFGTCFGVQDGDSYLSYLPLAHVLAMVVSNAVLHYGATMGFGNPKTLTDDAMVEGCLGDLREFRPTAFAGVPLVYDRIKAGILKKVEAESKLKQMIFKFALVIKQYAWKQHKRTPLLDAIVFNQFKSRLGGRVRLMVSGGAPLSSSAHLFLASCFGTPVLQGYGLTETCGAGTVMLMDDHSQGTVGPPVPCVEIKLVDVPEMGYLTTNNPPQGEIWMRGPAVTKGYYLAPEKTEEVYTADGWFKTGDIGGWNKNGTLSIVDRVKNLVKGPYGEYIALEKLESIYKNSSYVLNACVYADKEKPKIVAVVELQPPIIKERNLKDAANNKEFTAEVKKDLIETGRRNGLKRFELVTDVLLVNEEWNPDNNMLTAAMKLNRRSIYKQYQSRIDAAVAK